MNKQTKLFDESEDAVYKFAASQIMWDAKNIKQWAGHYSNEFIRVYSEVNIISVEQLTEYLQPYKNSIYDIFERAYIDILSIIIPFKDREKKPGEQEKINIEYSKIMNEAISVATKTTSDILISLGKRPMFKNPLDFKKAFAHPREISKMWGRQSYKVEPVEVEIEQGGKTKRAMVFKSKDSKVVYRLASEDIKTAEHAQLRIDQALGSEGIITTAALLIYTFDNHGFRQNNVKIIDLMKSAGLKPPFNQAAKRDFTRRLNNLNGLQVWVDKDGGKYVDRYFYYLLEITRARYAKIGESETDIDTSVINELDFEILPRYNDRAELRGRLFSRNIVKLNPGKQSRIVKGVVAIQKRIDENRTGRVISDDKVYVNCDRKYLIESFDLVELNKNNSKAATQKLNTCMKAAIKTGNLSKCIPEKITSDPKQKYKIYGPEVSYKRQK
jgi:hypothetical protein